jgi:signal transduction histidine kinase
MIVRGVKKEISQRERIESLAKSLESSNNKLEDVNLSLQVANEKLKELDTLKSEFVSMATHQIRGPLSAIKGYISMMTDGDYGQLPENLTEPLKVIFKSTDMLSKMVTDFLDVSKIDLGQIKYEFSEFDLRDLVKETVAGLKPNIDAKGLELRLNITDQPCPVKADKVKVSQVLNNLIDNACKYTKQGWMEVSIENKNGKVLFAVKDSGMGISSQTLGTLFQRFSRAKNANDSNTAGSGLGLYIAKKMMEANSGRVWAESAGVGQGSQFYVEIPSL